MKPLPRLLAYLDDTIAARDDLGIGLAAIAAAGPAVALVARLPGGTTDALGRLAERCLANARPPEAQVFVSGRVDVALAIGADGVIARGNDLPISEMRRLVDGRPRIALVASVHSVAEAEAAVEDGADALVVGTIWPSTSHPGRGAAGTALLAQCASLGRPIYAIGGVTAERAREARAAGAWGVAAIRALWEVKDHFKAAVAMLEALTGQ